MLSGAINGDSAGKGGMDEDMAAGTLISRACIKRRKRMSEKQELDIARALSPLGTRPVFAAADTLRKRYESKSEKEIRREEGDIGA